MRAKWRERVWTHNVATHRCCDKSCISTPEICAHDSVYTVGSVGTSAPKKIIQVVPSEYVHFTAFFRPRWGAFPELVLERFLALLELQKGWKQVETAPLSSISAQDRKNLDLDARGARKGHFKSG